MEYNCAKFQYVRLNSSKVTGGWAGGAGWRANQRPIPPPPCCGAPKMPGINRVKSQNFILYLFIIKRLRGPCRAKKMPKVDNFVSNLKEVGLSDFC